MGKESLNSEVQSMQSVLEDYKSWKEKLVKIENNVTNECDRYKLQMQELAKQNSEITTTLKDLQNKNANLKAENLAL